VRRGGKKHYFTSIGDPTYQNPVVQAGNIGRIPRQIVNPLELRHVFLLNHHCDEKAARHEGNGRANPSTVDCHINLSQENDDPHEEPEEQEVVEVASRLDLVINQSIIDGEWRQLHQDATCTMNERFFPGVWHQIRPFLSR
jgi:hypothetical protein